MNQTVGGSSSDLADALMVRQPTVEWDTAPDLSNLLLSVPTASGQSGQPGVAGVSYADNLVSLLVLPCA